MPMACDAPLQYLSRSAEDTATVARKVKRTHQVVNCGEYMTRVLSDLLGILVLEERH